PVADAVLVPPHLGAGGADLLDLAVDVLVEAAHEALDLPGGAVAPARRQEGERGAEVVVLAGVGQRPAGGARLGGGGAGGQRPRQAPGRAVALEQHHLAVAVADRGPLADVGIALEALLEGARLPGALGRAGLPLERELIVADLLADVGRQELVRG